MMRRIVEVRSQVSSNKVNKVSKKYRSKIRNRTIAFSQVYIDVPLGHGPWDQQQA